MTNSKNKLCTDKGTYLLILISSEDTELKIGKLGKMWVRPGFYYYVGSAFGSGGLKARVGRHINTDGLKSIRWHIDYLLQKLKVHTVWLSDDKDRLENKWVYSLSGKSELRIPLTGFGCSDSNASSHLFYSENILNQESIRRTLTANNLWYHQIH